MAEPVVRALVASLSALLLAACGATVAPTRPPSATPSATLAATPTATPSPAPTATPSRSATAAPTASWSPSPTASAIIGLPRAGCTNGWLNPPAGSAAREEGLTILMNYMGLTDRLIVEDMRYFIGPDPDWIIEPRFEAVEHWYIKATLSTDPAYRGRWLVERRDEQRLGVSAVAPYDTEGYQSPDWSGFVGDGIPRPIGGLPGLWGGIQYDFVTGEGDSGFPGLDESQAECMAGT